jgi:predicted RNA-binding protein (virulence factor B family)
VKIGIWNTLRLDRFTSVGAYLVDEEENDVLLPNKYILPEFDLDDMVDVFLYKDSQQRLIATTLIPKMLVNQFAYLYIEQVNQFGAFAFWGVEKHLLIPFKEQPKKLEEGKSYLIYMFLDDATQRLVGSTRIGLFLSDETSAYSKNDSVEIVIWEHTDLGTKVIVNDEVLGLIFKSDLYGRVRLGERMNAVVKNVREDGKLDIALLQEGYDKIDPLGEELLELLKENDGFLDLSDKSDPEEVFQKTGWSKKVFKQVIGNLYKKRLILISENGITLNLENNPE